MGLWLKLFDELLFYISPAAIVVQRTLCDRPDRCNKETVGFINPITMPLFRKFLTGILVILHRRGKSSLAIVLGLSLLSGYATALDIGFELSSNAFLSDNLNQENQGEEVDGSVSTSTVEVFGSHDSRRVRAGFLGLIGVRQQLSSDNNIGDGDRTSLNRFFGSVDLTLTRQVSWFFGNVLGGTLRDNAIAVTNQAEILDNRRNVFITGPQLDIEFNSLSRLEGRLFSISSSDDIGTPLPDFLELQLDYERGLGAGLGIGWRVENISGDYPSEAIEPDFDRLTVGLTGTRTRNLNTWDLFLGATQFSVDNQGDFETNGLVGRLRFDRRNSEFNNFFAEVSRSILDDALSATNSLIDSGDARTPEAPGVFNDTTFRVGQEFTTTVTSYAWDLGVSNEDFEGVLGLNGFTNTNAEDQDQRRLFGNFNITRRLAARWRVGALLNYQQEDFLNNDDNTESLQAQVTLGYLFGNFTFETSLQHEIMEGFETDLDGVVDITDATENQVLFRLSYEPPTRANREAVEQLSTFLF